MRNGITEFNFNLSGVKAKFKVFLVSYRASTVTYSVEKMIVVNLFFFVSALAKPQFSFSIALYYVCGVICMARDSFLILLLQRQLIKRGYNDASKLNVNREMYWKLLPGT